MLKNVLNINGFWGVLKCFRVFQIQERFGKLQKASTAVFNMHVLHPQSS